MKVHKFCISFEFKNVGPASARNARNDRLMIKLEMMDDGSPVNDNHKQIFIIICFVTCTKLVIVRTAVVILRTQAVALASQ